MLVTKKSWASVDYHSRKIDSKMIRKWFTDSEVDEDYHAKFIVAQNVQCVL